MTKRTIIATAVSIFAAGTFATAAHADGVKCGGVNACKGQSACKGQGWVPAKTSLECTAANGRVVL